MQLLNVKRNKESMVYGKLLVNLNSTGQGAAQRLDHERRFTTVGRDKCHLRDAGIPAHGSRPLSDLVTFTDFSDTLLTRRHRPEAPLPIGGLDL